MLTLEEVVRMKVGSSEMKGISHRTSASIRLIPVGLSIDG